MIPSPSTLALFSALLGAAAAIPAPQPGRFTLNQTRNANFRRHGPSEVAKTYLKYGRPVPAELAASLGMTAAAANQKRSHGSAATYPEQYDSEWLTPVQIGTPAQTLNLDFDSGSSDLWVFSTDTSSRYVNGQTLYSPAKSSTAKKLTNGRWSISYGDGSSSSGIVYTDVVTVGGLTVANQAVESAQTVSSSFTQESNLDGLLGLAFSTLNTVTPTQQKTWFDNIKASLDSPIFAVDFKAGGVPGSYDFGYIDAAKHTGAITYTSVSSRQGFWEFVSTGYAVGSGSFKTTSLDGIADTGTTLLYLPSAVVSAYWAAVSGSKNDASAGGYTFPCAAALPDFTFGIGSARVVIPGAYINYAPYTGSTCFGGIQSSSGIGINIFGDVALKAAYVVFDSNGPRIGWAAKNL
ncbi:putative A Chain Endothiapepsin In Complex With A Fragment [Rosellinia necatrix]|uniref:Putative A Chain Endothiapepsin In Complex With A n=1 Tax=Rosellinia necatrix TaxID=77044 RepID=A0A1W2TSM7_ROSNE|nr:putative A Chain Endothiapepsin In Complex With A Fragment [Rosellinia necatrix]